MLDDFSGQGTDVVAPFKPLPRELVGPLTKGKLAAMLTSFQSRYVDGDMPLNFLEGQKNRDQVRDWLADCFADLSKETIDKKVSDLSKKTIDAKMDRLFEVWDKTCSANAMYVDLLIDGMKCAHDPSRLNPELHKQDDQTV
jgi:hypothetical protein